MTQLPSHTHSFSFLPLIHCPHKYATAILAVTFGSAFQLTTPLHLHYPALIGDRWLCPDIMFGRRDLLLRSSPSIYFR